jgi:hypothetical protein
MGKASKGSNYCAAKPIQAEALPVIWQYLFLSMSIPGQLAILGYCFVSLLIEQTVSNTETDFYYLGIFQGILAKQCIQVSLSIKIINSTTYQESNEEVQYRLI